MHENNILGKISKNYKGKRQHIQDFYNNFYIPMRLSVDNFDFTLVNAFDEFARIMNTYDENITNFINENNITLQSKLKSSLYEEISCYLFKDLPKI